jgi:hypothetical protein
LEVPKFQGFFSEEQKAKSGESVQNLGGRQFRAQEVYKRKLFAIQPGEIRIDPARVSAVVDPFEGPGQWLSNSLSVHVLPLPKYGQPSDFSGLVGDFSMTLEQRHFSAKQNTPVPIQIQISGEGNLKSLSELAFEPSDEARIYKSKVTDQAGGRQWEYIVIPKNAGALRLKPIRLSFFSPNQGIYRTLSTGELSFDVAPSAGVAPVMVGTTSAGLSAESREATQINIDFHSFARPLGIMAALLAAGIVAYLLYGYGRRLWLKRDAKAWLRKNAMKLARKKVDSLHRLPLERRTAVLQTILLEFLSQKYGASFQAMTHDEMKRQLKTHGLSDEAIEAWMDLLERIAYMLYAPAATSQEERDSAIDQAKKKLV